VVKYRWRESCALHPSAQIHCFHSGAYAHLYGTTQEGAIPPKVQIDVLAKARAIVVSQRFGISKRLQEGIAVQNLESPASAKHQPNVYNVQI
jgi:hypothetical protein